LCVTFAAVVRVGGSVDLATGRGVLVAVEEVAAAGHAAIAIRAHVRAAGVGALAVALTAMRFARAKVLFAAVRCRVLVAITEVD
jgi:hypothetical protein